MSESFTHGQWEYPGGVKQRKRQVTQTICVSHGPVGKQPPVWCSWRPDGGCANVTSIVFSFLATLSKLLTPAVYLSNLCGGRKRWGLWADDQGAPPLWSYFLWGRNCGDIGLSEQGDASSGVQAVLLALFNISVLRIVFFLKLSHWGPTELLSCVRSCQTWWRQKLWPHCLVASTSQISFPTANILLSTNPIHF